MPPLTESAQPESQPSSLGSGLPWMPWLLGFALLVMGFMVWEPLPPGIWHDDGVYVLLGRSLAEGEGLRYVGIPGSPLAPKFPPLYPLVLALVWLVHPVFPENVFLLGGVNLILTAAASVLFTYLVRRITGWPLLAAVALAAFVFLSAHLWRVAAVPLSEPLFLLTLTGALLAGGWLETHRGRGVLLGFLAVAALAVFSRTLGVAVLGAGVLTLALDKRFRSAVGLGLASVGLLLPWIVWTRMAGATIPPSQQDILGSYTGWLGAQMAQQPGEFFGFLLGNSVQLLSRMATLLLPGFSGPVRLLGLAAIPFLVVGAIELYRKCRIVLLTLVLSLGILLVWPFQDVRLMVPFQPLLMLVLALGIHSVATAENLPVLLRRGTLAIAVLWAGAFATVSVSRLSGDWLQEGYRIRADALIDAVRAVTEKTPDTAVVGAPELWAGIHLFTGRQVVPSARFRPLSGGGPSEGTPDEQYEIWVEAGLTHVLVEHGGRVHGPAIDRIDAVCPPGTVELVDNQPGRYLVALHWDKACQERVRSVGGSGGRPDPGG